MQETTFTFKAADGLNIHVYSWLPDAGTEISRVMQIVHGSVEHAARYRRFAEALTRAGYAVYATDHRGHGHSSEQLGGQLGYFSDLNDGWQLCVDDLYHLSTIIKEKHPGKDLFIFGHSMGSMLVRNYIALHGEAVKGAVLCGNPTPNPLAAPGILLATIMMKIFDRRRPSKLITSMAFDGFAKKVENCQTASDWISSDPVEVQKYLDDPWCGYTITPEYIKQMLKGLQRIYRKDCFKSTPDDLPILMINGELDPCAMSHKEGAGLIERKFKENGCKNVRLNIYPKARHELLNEPIKEEVTADIINWAAQA